ncbi:MAG TPA: class I SAM-dependent methyltransferase, partial [Planctomycetota bacterium]|nr:class I SAM-dependent methyltransferase [Planctomycetota bacterium]
MSNPFVPRDASLESPAQHEESVKGLYQDQGVAENYIRNRFAWAWSRLLHESQIRILNDVIRANRFQTALEIAPGPARIAPDLTGLRSGIMVEASEPMIEVARRRLAEKDLERVWEIRHGNAFDLAPLGRTFDFAFTFRFLRHFEERERLRLYQEIAGRLNPSG